MIKYLTAVPHCSFNLIQTVSVDSAACVKSSLKAPDAALCVQQIQLQCPKFSVKQQLCLLKINFTNF